MEEEKGNFKIQEIEGHNRNLIRDELQKQLEDKIERIQKDYDNYQSKLSDVEIKLVEQRRLVSTGLNIKELESK